MTVHVELVGDRIELTGSVGATTQARARSIAKGSYRTRPYKHWRYPVTVWHCRTLRKVFGDELSIGPALNAWAREAIAQAERVVELRGAEAAELTNVPVHAPKIAEAMATRTYQQVGAAFIASAGNCMITDQPGLGKTIQVLGGIIEREGHETGLHLILCPRLAVPLVWGRQIEHWLGSRARVFTLQGTRTQREETLEYAYRAFDHEGVDVFVVGNIEMARATKLDNGKFPPASKFKPENSTWPALFEVEWDTVIADESHRAVIKSAGEPSATRVGFTRLRAKHKVAMSGTPMRGKPHQLWGTLNWLRPREYSNYWEWVGTYWHVSNGFFGGMEIGDYVPGGRERLARDLQNVSLRRTKAEVAPELPPKLYAGVHLIPGDDASPLADWLEMTPKQAKQYKRLMDDAAVYGTRASKMANGHLAVATREKQIAGAWCEVVDDNIVPDATESPKFEFLVNLFDSLGIEPDNEGDPSAKVIVASQFTSLLEVFAAKLRSMGYALHLLTGDVTSDVQRTAMVNDFQSEESTARIMFINTQVAGVAIELDAADDLVILDETYIPDDQEQLEDRAHRISRAHRLTIHKPRMLGTIEEEVAYVTAARQDEQQYILDGIRGVEVARRIYEQAKAV